MTNEYGLDVRYFRSKLSTVINGLENYTPDELARELVRLADTADCEEMRKEATRLNPVRD